MTIQLEFQGSKQSFTQMSTIQTCLQVGSSSIVMASYHLLYIMTMRRCQKSDTMLDLQSYSVHPRQPCNMIKNSAKTQQKPRCSTICTWFSCR